MFYPRPHIGLAGLLSLVCCAAVAANSEQQNNASDFYNLSLAELGQIEISIATGNSTPLDKAPATASVIYAAEIEAMGARNLNEILETIPGLHNSLSSLSRLDSVYSIRGIHTGFNAQVLLLVNGVPVQFSSQGGRPVLLRLPVASIDRVEVIRGPGSAVYGADAYAGVINVITKDAAAIDGVQMGASTGSFNSNEVWVQGADTWQDWGIAFTFAYQESDGDRRRRVSSDQQSLLDAFFGTTATLAPGPLSTRYQIFDAHLAVTSEQLQVNLWSWLSYDAGNGAGAAQALDPQGRDDSELFMADATYHLNDWSEHWSNSVRLSHLYYDLDARFRLMPPGTVLPIGPDGNVNLSPTSAIVAFPDGLLGRPSGTAMDTQFDVISIFTGWDAHRLRLAAGVRRQELDTRESKNFGPGITDNIESVDGISAVVDGTLTDVSDTPFVFLADSARTVRYLSLQDEWQIVSDWVLTAGLRYDHYTDFGGTTNPRLALVWATNEQLTTKLMYGSAFRAPSFSEQRFINNPVSIGNPLLSPEQINTLELSFNYRLNASFQSTLTLFAYEARDMIEFIPDENATTSTAQNARDIDGKGFEWEFNWNPAPRWRVSGNYSWQDAQDNDTSMAVADAPGQQFMLTANWEFRPDWSLNSQVNWVGDRQRASGDIRPDIADYTLIGATLRRQNLFPNLDVSVAVRNMTDEDAREPSNGLIAEDYPLESRSAWLELKYLFK